MSAICELLAEAIVGRQTVAILGAGSCLKCDDAAGVEVVEALEAKLGNELCSRLRIYNGSTAPENFTGEIKRFHPDSLLIIDAADMGLPPGAVALIDTASVSGVSFSTHMLPLKIMLEYLMREIGCRVYILGIQGKCLEYGADMTPEVRTSVELVVSAIIEMLRTDNL